MKVYEARLTFNLVREGESVVLNTTEKFVEYIRDAYDANPCQESFWVICLNRKLRPIGRTMTSLGTLTATLVHPREVFRIAILASASAIIVSHNHPTGDPAPSQADLQVTRQLRESAKALDIEFLDHVIIGNREDDPAGLGYYSFRASGLI